MSLQYKIMSACLIFVAIIALVGGLAQQQAAQMGRLAIGIYDHAFMGMSYVNQAQQAFLRLEAAHTEFGAKVSGSAELLKVQTLLDVASSSAASEHTRDAGRQTGALLAALAQIPDEALSAAMVKADQSLTRLVKKYASDGLETRDDADELATRSTHLVLMEITAAIILALGIGWLLGRNLSRPLIQIVRTIGALADGKLEQEVSPKLMHRRDEIGAVARAAGVFRDAMRQNARAGEEAQRIREQSEAGKQEALRSAADKVETETTKVAAKSLKSGDTLSHCATTLAASAARMLISVGGATGASRQALSNCEVVAAAGEELAASAREISGQVTASTVEVASTVRAGAQAHQIIERLSASMKQIGSVAGLIGDIAGRTNLLALNATIEAARAGEAGRGFAVVANEVKTLATQTARSTREINLNVKSIEIATHDAVTAVAEMVDRVAAIARITHAVAAAADQQTAATGEIARSVLSTAASMRIVSEQIELVTEEAHSTETAVADMQSVAGTVAEQITELRGVMVRIVRTSSNAVNRRTDERFPLHVPAALIVDGQEIEVECLDLGLGGARVRAARTLVAGARVTLRLAGLPNLTATVLADGQESGLHFAWEPGEAPMPLRDFLNRKAA